MSIIAARLNGIKPSPSAMASQRARELRAAGRDIIGLTSGEPDFDTPPNVYKELPPGAKRADERLRPTTRGPSSRLL